MLQEVWSSIHEMLPDEFDEFELEDKIQYIDDIEDEDEMDYELSDLYDFCDAENIWIPLSQVNIMKYNLTDFKPVKKLGSFVYEMK